MKPHTKATTSQILGGGKATPAPVRIPPQWQEHYDALVVCRAQLGKRKDGLNEIAREEQQAFSLHMADAGTDEFDRDFALSILSSDQNALFEIDAALERIRRGTYGLCEISGEAIEAERLLAIPWTRYSAAAQRELEEGGHASRTRLGERGAWNEPEPKESASSEEAEPEAA